MKNNQKLQIAFKKAQFWNPIDWIIRWRCGKYVHVELVFPELYIKGKTSFSSRIDGVTFKKVKYRKRQWNFLTLSDKYQNDILKIRKRCLDLVKKCPEYDYIGAVADAGFDIPIDDKQKWFCSEVIAYVIGLKSYKVNPTQLYEIIINDE